MNNPVDVQGYQPPSPLEQRFYLAGLGGDPELIARTSTERFVYTPEDRLRKQLATLGAANALALHWSPGLRDRLVETLQAPFGHEAVLVNVRESSNIMSPVGKAGPSQSQPSQTSQTSLAVLEWTAVLPVRLGYHEAAPKQFQDPKQFATVLLITVDRGSRYEWRTAMHKALACRALLHRAHRSLSSVEVVVAACTVDAQASRSAEFLATRMDWAMDGFDPSKTIQSTMMPILPFSGCTITQATGGLCGSLGPVVRLGNRKGKGVSRATICGLTSRHVAVGPLLAAHLSYNTDTDKHGTALNAGLLTGNADTTDCALELNDQLHIIQEETRDMWTRLKADPSDDEAANGLEALENCKAYVDKLQASLDDASATTVSSRFIGRVLYTPKFALSRRRNLQDWALFELELLRGGSGSSSSFNENRVYIDKSIARAASIWANRMQNSIRFSSASTSTSTSDGRVFHLVRDRFLRLHGQGMPAAPPFVRTSPSSSSSSSSSPPFLLVAKRGPKTGLTFGLVNEIEAVKRVPYSSGNEMISLHMLILPTDNHAAFSAKGDSGSAIFDCNGCIVGMVDAGTRMDRSLPQPPQQQQQPQQRSSASRNKENVPFPSSASRAPQPQPQPPTSAMSSMTIAPANVSMDVTFATPIQWLLEDIQAFTGCDVEIA